MSDNNNQKEIKDFFEETMSLRNLNLEKLASLTGIPRNHLIALCEGERKKLPAAPYLRGYFLKIGEALRVDGEELWEIYKKKIASSAAASDNLPTNRFIAKKINKKIVVIGIVLFFAIIYFVWRGDKLLGIPEVKIINPAVEETIVFEPLILLKGIADNFYDKLLINGEEIFINKDGSFEKEHVLNPGVNVVEFKINRFLGKEIKIERKIIYQQQNF